MCLYACVSDESNTCLLCVTKLFLFTCLGIYEAELSKLSVFPLSKQTVDRWWVRVYVCKRFNVCVSVCASARVCVCVCVRARVCVCGYVYVHVCGAYMFMCVGCFWKAELLKGGKFLIISFLYA